MNDDQTPVIDDAQWQAFFNLVVEIEQEAKESGTISLLRFCDYQCAVYTMAQSHLECLEQAGKDIETLQAALARILVENERLTTSLFRMNPAVHPYGMTAERNLMRLTPQKLTEAVEAFGVLAEQGRKAKGISRLLADRGEEIIRELTREVDRLRVKTGKAIADTGRD